MAVSLALDLKPSSDNPQDKVGIKVMAVKQINKNQLYRKIKQKENDTLNDIFFQIQSNSKPTAGL